MNIGIVGRDDSRAGAPRRCPHGTRLHSVYPRFGVEAVRRAPPDPSARDRSAHSVS